MLNVDLISIYRPRCVVLVSRPDVKALVLRPRCQGLDLKTSRQGLGLELVSCACSVKKVPVCYTSMYRHKTELVCTLHSSR